MYSKSLVKTAMCLKLKCKSPPREASAEGSTGDMEAAGTEAVVMTGKTINTKNTVFDEKSTKRNQIYWNHIKQRESKNVTPPLRRK